MLVGGGSFTVTRIGNRPLHAPEVSAVNSMVLLHLADIALGSVLASLGIALAALEVAAWRQRRAERTAPVAELPTSLARFVPVTSAEIAAEFGHSFDAVCIQLVQRTRHA